MSNYKLMPVEPTREQLDAFKSLWAFGFCNDDMARNCYRTFMQTAPEVGGDEDCPAMTICKLCSSPSVQGEPVLYVSQYAIVDPDVVGMHATRTQNELQCVPLYAAPQPAEQQPELEDCLSSKKDFYDDAVEDIAFALAFECEEAELDPNDKVTINREKLKAIAARVLEKVERGVSEQQPAPDVEELAHALRCAMAFIKSHVADPDITPEMQAAYQELEAAKPDEILARYAETVNAGRPRKIGVGAFFAAQTLAQSVKKLKEWGGAS